MQGPEHHRRFARLMRDLDTLIANVRQYEPKAEFYMEDAGNMLLMVGPSHDDDGRAQHDLVAHFERVRNAGGGGW